MGPPRAEGSVLEYRFRPTSGNVVRSNFRIADHTIPNAALATVLWFLGFGLRYFLECKANTTYPRSGFAAGLPAGG